MDKNREIVAIHVRQEDIDSGTPSNTLHCPVAKAVKREFPKADFVTVGPYEASVYFSPKRRWKIFRIPARFIRFYLPSRVTTFIVNFDSYGRNDEFVRPFSFEAIAVETKQ